MDRQIDWIVLHCTDSDNPNQNVDIVTRWQTDPRFNLGAPLKMIAYHYLILFNGLIQRGRPEEMPGAGEPGYNKNGLHIALTGRRRFTAAQFVSLENLFRVLKPRYPHAKLVGHGEINKGPPKSCPNFDCTHLKGVWNRLDLHYRERPSDGKS